MIMSRLLLTGLLQAEALVLTPHCDRYLKVYKIFIIKRGEDLLMPDLINHFFTQPHSALS